MNTKRVLGVTTMLLGLLLGQDALAFYNSSTGRWLSRDPIGENGFKALTAAHRRTDASWLDTKRTRQSAGTMRFCGNIPTDRADALGLDDKTAAELAGYCQDPCKEYWDREKEDNEGFDIGGAAICCGGKLYFCSYGHEKLKNRRARELVENCIKEHERTHDRNHHLVPCAECNWDATKPGFREGVKKNQAECEAHTKELDCLNFAFELCQGSPECEEDVLRIITAIEAAKNAFCNAARRVNTEAE